MRRLVGRSYPLLRFESMWLGMASRSRNPDATLTQARTIRELPPQMKNKTLAKTTTVRRIILMMLFGFSFVSYLERVNISIASEWMMPALSLTKMQMGHIFSGFLIGYAIFQIPAGMLGNIKVRDSRSRLQVYAGELRLSSQVSCPDCSCRVCRAPFSPCGSSDFCSAQPKQQRIRSAFAQFGTGCPLHSVPSVIL